MDCVWHVSRLAFVSSRVRVFSRVCVTIASLSTKPETSQHPTSLRVNLIRLKSRDTGTKQVLDLYGQHSVSRLECRLLLLFYRSH